MYRFGNTSLKRLGTGSAALQKVLHRAMEISNERKGYTPDWGIAEVLRTQKQQQDRYAQGRDDDGNVVNQAKVITYCDGINNKSYHQSGHAVDVFAYVNGKYNVEPCNLALITTCLMQAASELGMTFEWGGHYRTFYDGCHFNLKPTAAV